VLVPGRCEDRYASVMDVLAHSDRIEIVGPDRAPDVVVELRHPDCWKKVPHGKRFPAVVVMPQLLSPCTEDQAFGFRADEFVDDERDLVDVVIETHLARHAKSA
jgi:hypothetical protein